MGHQLFFPSISESSQVAEARRLTVQMAGRLGFNETEAGRLAIVVTEIATNLVKHAAGGCLLIRALARDHRLGLEILALDRGPGISNLGESLRDGYSNTGTSGTGLGAIIRLSSLFDIHSLPGKGTALLAQMWSQNSKAESLEGVAPCALELGVVCLPKPGEEANGDNWQVAQDAQRCLILLVDGLGHGVIAAEAALAATTTLTANPNLSPASLVRTAHAALRKTRGAALAIVAIDSAGSAKFSGIGNITGTILTLEKNHYLTSHNGIVGHQLPRVQEFTYPWPEKALLVLHSDGLTTRWDLDAYPGLRERHPGLIAGVLYRDFQRGYDDVTVLVVKQ